jgi:hypothetical protein
MKDTILLRYSIPLAYSKAGRNVGEPKSIFFITEELL